MKSLLLGSASVAAVLLGLAGSAQAQFIDAGELVDGLVDLPGTLNPDDVAALPLVDIGVSNLLSVPAAVIGIDAPITAAVLGGLVTASQPGGVAGVVNAGNLALSVAPNLSIQTNVAAPLDPGAALTGLGLAVGASPNTISVAALLPVVDIARLGGEVTVGAVEQTTFGQIVNQASQAAFETDGTITRDFASFTGGGSSFSVDEASEAAVTIGDSTSASAARFAATAITNDLTAITDGTIEADTATAVDGIYLANIALGVAPMLSLSANVGTSVTVGDIAQTTFSQIVNQTTSLGYEGANLASAITGNFEGTATPPVTTPSTGTTPGTGGL